MSVNGIQNQQWPLTVDGLSSLYASSSSVGSVQLTSATPNRIVITDAADNLISAPVNYTDLVPYTGATAAVALGAQNITTSHVPAGAADLTNKLYVDQAITTAGSAYVPYTGATSAVDLNGQELKTTYMPTVGADVTNKTYVDGQTALKVSKAGDVMTGTLTVPNITATSLTTSTPSFTLGIDGSSQIIKYANPAGVFSGSVSSGYVPYASTLNVFSNSLLYQGTTFIGIGTTVSGLVTQPTGTTNSLTVNGSIIYTEGSLSSGSAILGQDVSTNKNFLSIQGGSGVIQELFYGHAAGSLFYDAAITVSNSVVPSANNTGTMEIDAGSLLIVAPTSVSGALTTSSTVTLNGVATGTPTKTLGINASNQIVTYTNPGSIFTGSVSTGYVPYASSANVFSNSALYQSGSNVGIGNTAPGYNLDVTGTARITTELIITESLGNTATRPTVSAGATNNSIWGANTNTAVDDGFLRIAAGGGTSSSTKSYIDISGYSTVADMDRNIVLGTAATERMRITAAGYVGIGITNPSYPLTIAQPSGDVYARIQAVSGATGYSGILFTEPGTYGHTIRYNAATDNLEFCSQDNTPTFTQRMVIQWNGNIGIGTATPNAMLDVRGLVFGSSVYALVNGSGSTNGYASMQAGDTGHTGYLNFFQPGGTRTGYIGFADSSFIYLDGDGVRSFAFGDLNTPIINSYPYAITLWSTTTFVNSTSTFLSSSVISGGFTSWPASSYVYLPMGYNWWTYQNLQHWSPLGTAGNLANRWYVPYSGIWACTYSQSFSNTIEMFISTSMGNGTNAGAGNDLNVVATCVATQFCTNNEGSVHWTGYVSAGNWICFGFYTLLAGTQTNTARTGLSISLIQRTA